MNWITRKIKSYVWAVVVFCYHSVTYYFTKKRVGTCILLADFDEYGGTRTYFEQLVTFLAGKNEKVICLVTEKQKNEAFLELMQLVGFEYKVISKKEYVIEYSGKWTAQSFSYYLNKLLTDLNNFLALCKYYKADSFYISSGEPEKWLYLFFLPVKKMRYVLHTVPYRDIGNIGKFTLKKRLSKNKIIIGVSEFSKQAVMQSWKISKDDERHVKVVYNYFKPAENPAKIYEERPLRVLTLGHLESYKNPFFWIEVAKTIMSKVTSEDVEFVWAGDGSSMKPCQNKVKNSPSIKFLGYRKNVDELYRNSDIYFQPSLVESHGIAVVGAMSYGLPCVVSKVGGLPESVINNYNGYCFNVNSEAQAVDFLFTLINDKNKRKEAGCNSISRFDQLFSERQWKSKMRELI